MFQDRPLALPRVREHAALSKTRGVVSNETTAYEANWSIQAHGRVKRCDSLQRPVVSA